jgi:aspartate carbamoyltransferase regulatory subunit
MGTKDIVKVENRVLLSNEIDAISLFCVDATLSIIQDFKVVSKSKLSMPNIINEIIVCPNIRCVSHHYKSKFISVVDYRGINVYCDYCEQSYSLREISKYNV